MQVRIKVTNQEIREIIIAELADFGFDAFLEEGDELVASIDQELYDKRMLEKSLDRFPVSFSVQRQEQENWNKKWESNFPMTIVSDELLIRAPFHNPERSYPLEVEIMPKMSFGTGHHATTFLMASQLMQLDCQGKRVLDAGSGTGVLGIIAAKRGAAYVAACDIEEWAVINARENAERNQVSLQVSLGTVSQYEPAGFDLLLANINRNTLLEEFGQYARLLRTGGICLCSGFLPEDEVQISQEAQKQGLSPCHAAQKDNWSCLGFAKP